MQCAGRVDEGASTIVVTTALWDARTLTGTLVFISRQRPDFLVSVIVGATEGAQLSLGRPVIIQGDAVVSPWGGTSATISPSATGVSIRLDSTEKPAFWIECAVQVWCFFFVQSIKK